MTDVRIAPLAFVRHTIASAFVRDRSLISEQLGAVTLRPAQRDAAARLSSLIALHGGAMLAEPVGLGKTYTALAVAMHVSESTLIVCPASLRAMWRASLSECGVKADVVTHEALSRGAGPPGTAGLVIVDEAHRLRSAKTRRYAALAGLCRTAKVLLVTATPVQNRRADLAAQLALFLGRIAWEMTDADLIEHVVRESSCDHDGQPRLVGPITIASADDAECLDAILSLPPPIPAKNESLAFALMTYGLIHQWTSSHAALVVSLERRRARGLALLSSVDAGRMPTRAELSAWSLAGDAVQLAFPELVVAAAESDDIGLDEVRASLVRHDGALRDLLHALRLRPNDADAGRANALRRIRAAHPGERIIAFCHYAETVNALRTLLAAESGIAALTARGVRVAGGKIGRDDVLAQYAPRARDAPRPREIEHISLLISTDLLSEGLNLQEASVVVHLDLPWNPARLEQRVGRVRRLGSRHPVVTVYTFAPPAPAERLLRIEARLRDKLAVAAGSIGAIEAGLPALCAARSQEIGLAEELGAVTSELRGWTMTAGASSTDGRCVAAAVRADHEGFLALVRDAGREWLVAGAGPRIATEPRALRRSIASSAGPETDVDLARLDGALQHLEQWLASRRGAAAVGAHTVASTRSRRVALVRIAKLLAATPPHRRSSLAALVGNARHALAIPLNEGAERELDDLAVAPLADDEWLGTLADFADEHGRPTGDANVSTVRAIILLQAAVDA